ncbi:zinc-ribbon domain-containing protein [Leisingera caerulea]|uniref:Zinc-ribbon domain-containing protein n=1 Tax=Leisingera caerulea TaxID=506591 RepID=A0A9Q9HGA7_LEICA|nr:zinc-ribbon domain-containing protein [Leisingera caerulea]UWQ54583.1 zinc-ribbon domain-containing protein [Leisingera caerulea]
MRLTCPNCAAEYEVPEDVIPAEGRDVQCSNCGQTWFQAAAGETAAAPVAEDAPAPADAAEEPEQDAAASAPQQAPEDAAEDAAEPAPERGGIEEEAADFFANSRQDGPDGFAQDAAEDMPQQQAEPQPQRARGLDPALTDILREEAEREASLRAAESQSLETQPDLGLEEATAPEDEAARRSRQARDRMARMRGEDPRQLAAAESGSRKELLPDIEEINSTLRSGGSAAPAPQAAAEAPPVRRKNNFARGFSLSLIAALVMVMVYDNAALIAEKVPLAESALSSYVSWVDQMRLWLDAQAKTLISAQ